MRSKRAVAQDLAVGDAVERHAAGQAQVLRCRSPRRATRVSRSMTSSVTAWIEAARSMWRWVEQLVGLARRPAEQRVEPAVGHGQAGAVVEIAQVRAGSEPSALRSIRWSRISSAYLGSP